MGKAERCTESWARWSRGVGAALFVFAVGSCFACGTDPGQASAGVTQTGGEGPDSRPTDDPSAGGAKTILAESQAAGALTTYGGSDRTRPPISTGTGGTAGSSGSWSPEEYAAASASRPEGIGPCGETWVDYECDAILRPCPAGMHRDFDPDDPCAICVPNADEPLSCELARRRYDALLAHVVPSSCADYCLDDADCFVFELSTSCLSRCILPLYGAIDEEIVEVAAQFAAESCDLVCGDDPPPTCPEPEGTEVECVQNRCVLR